MKHFRYILLCLSLVAAVGLLVGCGCRNPQDETSQTTTESGSAGMTESQTQESTRETMQESSSYPADIYETGDGMYDATDGVNDGAGSIGTDDGVSPAPDAHGGASQNGGHGSGNGTGETGGLMEDVTDGLDQIGEDVSDAVDDMTNNSRTRSR